MSEDPDKERGLYQKYDVNRKADAAGKHIDCRYFVLDPVHDRMAFFALMRYAELAHRRGYRKLSADLFTWLEEVQNHHNYSSGNDS